MRYSTKLTSYFWCYFIMSGIVLAIVLWSYSIWSCVLCQGLLQLRLGVCEWSPEGLHDKSVPLIPNTDEILKLAKKKNELIGLHFVDTQAWSCRKPWLCWPCSNGTYALHQSQLYGTEFMSEMHDNNEDDIKRL